MSNDKSFKHIFKPLGKFIIIHSLGEEKKTSVIVPKLDTYREHRQWEDFENTVYAIGDEVTKVKIGDKVLLDAHTKLRKLEKITKIVEEKSGVKFTIQQKDDKGETINEIETKKYFAVTEDDIIAIIN